MFLEGGGGEVIGQTSQGDGATALYLCISNVDMITLIISHKSKYRKVLTVK